MDKRAIVQASAFITEEALGQDGARLIEEARRQLALELAHEILKMPGVFEVDSQVGDFPHILARVQVELVTDALLHEIIEQTSRAVRRGRVPVYNHVTGTVEAR
jgi:uncharacterized protein (UPF0216 family)